MQVQKSHRREHLHTEMAGSSRRPTEAITSDNKLRGVYVPISHILASTAPAFLLLSGLEKKEGDRAEEEMWRKELA